MHDWGAQIREARSVHYLVLVLSANFCIMKQLIAIPQNREVLNFVLSVLCTLISNLLFYFLNLTIDKVFLSLYAHSPIIYNLSLIKLIIQVLNRFLL